MFYCFSYQPSMLNFINDRITIKVKMLAASYVNKFKPMLFVLIFDWLVLI